MDGNKSVVVVDDDPVTRESISGYFEQEGFIVSTAENYDGLKKIIQERTIDLLLLDIRLPGQDGLSIMRELRQKSDVAVILVTGRTDEVDRVIGLEMGADDYVTKPFSPRELLARARTVLRRTGKTAESAPLPAPTAPANDGALTFAGWRFDGLRRRLTSPQGEDVRLTRGEFELLAALLRQPGRVLTRDNLLDEISHRDWAPSDRTVDVLVARLRRKIEADPAAPRLIVTEHGVGYVFAERVN